MIEYKVEDLGQVFTPPNIVNEMILLIFLFLSKYLYQNKVSGR